MKKIYGVTASLFASMLVAGSAQACGDATEQVHVGKISQLDAGKNTFTLNDMETGKALTFAAAPDLLLKLATVTRPVSVKYSVKGEQMTAMSVR